MKKLRIGLAQINPIVGDYDGNTKKIMGYINEAENKALDLVIFPELSLCGYPLWDLANKKRFVNGGLERLKLIAKSTKNFKVGIILGFVDKSNAQRKNHNALCLISKGKIVHKQYKTLLPTYDVFLEEVFFSPGKEQKTFLFKGVKMGATICEDIWDDTYSVKPTKVLAKKGIKLLINISASPYRKGIVDTRKKLIKEKAKNNKIAIVYVNQVGGQDDLIFDGSSMVCDSKGNISFIGEPFKERLYEVEVCPDGTKQKNVALEEKRHELKNVYDALVLGVKDYVRKNGFKKAVIGLSGGADSSLVACIARDALGAGNVVGVSMPGKYSSEASFEDAKELAGNLGIEFRTIPIKDVYDFMINKILKGRDAKDVSLAMENLQARLRAIELMYISNEEKMLLLSTGNKSELAVGYCTLYGDMCGGLSVLGDVYKTDIYKLADYRNTIDKVIPPSVLEKAPSAELRPNQKDQDSLPPYEILDEILECYIEKNMSRDEIMGSVGKKAGSEVIDDVLWKIDHNEYKRRQAAPTLKVTRKSWFGRRMPITNLFKGQG